MNAIDNLVFNTLVKQEAVYLPGIGCLKVICQKSEHAGGKVVAPRVSVAFTKSAVKNSVSIVDLIARGDGVDTQGAQTLYGEWLSTARRADGKISIEGVGVIGPKNFIPDNELLTAIGGEELPVVTVKKRCRYGWIWWVVAALIIAAAAVYYFLCPVCCRKTAEEAAVVVEVVEPAEEPAVVEPEPVKVAELDTNARYNVTIGAFEYPENASRLVAADPLGIGSENYLIAPFRYGWKIVIACATNDKDEAVAALRKYRRSVPDVWIYYRY